MDNFNQETIKANNEYVNRVNTGLNELDELISGGLPMNSIILVSGTPGSGKTILCFHFLMKGLNNGENCLYLTSDERIENILKQANGIGLNFQHWIDQGKLKFQYLDLDKSDVHKKMDEAIKTGNYSRVVLDSLTPISEVPVWISSNREIIPKVDSVGEEKYPIESIPSTRMHIRRVMSILSKENCTAMVTSEVLEGSRSLSRDSISEFMVDGIILMDLDMTMDRRKLTIRKMRATKHTLKPQDITITEGGIKFL